MKKLIKSYKFWVAFSGAVGIFLMSLSSVIGISINVEGVKESIMAFCGILIVFGIVKKPQNKQEKLNDNNENIASDSNKEK